MGLRNVGIHRTGGKGRAAHSRRSGDPYPEDMDDAPADAPLDPPLDASAPIVWMSTGEAAEFLGLRTRTLYRLIDEGQLAAFRFGRVIRLTRADVQEFVERCRIVPGSLDHLYVDGADRVTSSTASSSR